MQVVTTNNNSINNKSPPHEDLVLIKPANKLFWKKSYYVQENSYIWKTLPMPILQEIIQTNARHVRKCSLKHWINFWISLCWEICTNIYYLEFFDFSIGHWKGLLIPVYTLTDFRLKCFKIMGSNRGFLWKLCYCSYAKESVEMDVQPMKLLVVDWR